MIELVIFIIFAAIAITAAIGVVALRNPVHSALSLALVFVCLAALYLLLNAPFIAAAQVMIYAGAILILFLFVIMVLNPRIEIGEGRLPGQRLYAGLIGAALVVELIITFAAARYAPAGTEFTPEKIIRIGHPEAIAGLLFTEFLLPFEITSLLLLVAIVGVIVLAKRRKSD